MKDKISTIAPLIIWIGGLTLEEVNIMFSITAFGISIVWGLVKIYKELSNKKSKDE